MGAPEEAPLARSLGAFFGHIVGAISSDPAAPAARAEVRRETEERPGPGGVILRRTVIEEVVLPPGTPLPAPQGERPANT